MTETPQQHPTARVVIPRFPERLGERPTHGLAPRLELQARLRPVLDRLRVR